MDRRGGKETGRVLKKYYEALFKAFGPQGWWPGETRFEVIAGAILTQNTSWSNVEKAIKALKSRGLLVPERMHGISAPELALYIRPAGYFNIKAKRLKNFLSHLFENHGGKINRLLDKKNGKLRDELLSINGIGPETADSILLYAAGRPEFVVDAYTKRIFSRHGFVDNDIDYQGLKNLFMEGLAGDTRLFNEYHALIVRTGKDFCRNRAPLCGACPLGSFLPAKNDF